MIAEKRIIEPDNPQTDKNEEQVISGINVAGYLQAESGLGEAARGTVRALEAVNIPYVLNNCNFNLEYHNIDKSFTNFSKDNPYPVNVVQINADSMFKFLDTFSTEYLANRYNIGFWLWEMLRFPREWFYAFNLFDEIWTPSNFCVEAFSAVSPVPVVRIPLPINMAIPSLGRAALGLPENKFIFLFIFDFCSAFERKNPGATIRAFLQAFGRENKDVLLVVKSNNADFEPAKAAQMQALADGAENIKFIDKSLPRNELDALIYNADCYVSLHRCEGFGLTLAEAMYYGKPVIATDYSANTDFMNIGNSFPVKYKLETLQEDLIFFRKGDQWADADTEHAAGMMRFVFENQERAKDIGVAAARYMREMHSTEAVGQKIKSRLQRIWELQDNFVHGKTEDIFQSQLKSSRIKLEYLEAENHQMRERVRLMEASKFWKVRSRWFALKRKLGITRKY